MKQCSLFAKPGVSKLCTLSMRQRPYNLIFTVSLLLICLFASICVVKAILEFALLLSVVFIGTYDETCEPY